ncbi:2-oxo acid dehydrogenase subunit E2, partial [bacterium]|nr:2-oxo acid dehydrogenase subunit E2 [bacterium]
MGCLLGTITPGEASGTSQSSVQEAKSTTVEEVVVDERFNDFESPAVAVLAKTHGVDVKSVNGTGKDGRVTKADLQKYLDAKPVQVSPKTVSIAPSKETIVSVFDELKTRSEEPKKIPRIRKKIAQRLKEVQNTAAILTTFNEVDMTEIMALRSKYKDEFKEKHGVGLGFMSLFTKACVEALKRFPDVNCEWRGEELIYKNFCDVGIAVGTDKGLV